MSKLSLVRHFLVVCIIGILSLPATAQIPGTGAYPFSKLDSPGFDNINPGNLNVHFSIPVVSKAGRGVPFNYSLVFDSLIWTPTVSGSTTLWTPDLSFGLHGYLLNDGYKGFLSYTSITKKCFDDPNNPGSYELLAVQSNYVYHDEFGVNHPFNYSYSVCTGSATGDGSTNDNSGLSFDGANVHTRSGLTLSLPQYVNGAAGALSATITDSNGNRVTNSQNGTFTDTMGLTPLAITGSGTAASPRIFTYQTTTGTATVTITYATKTVKTAFACSGVSEYGPKNVDLPVTITLGDSTLSYALTYESTPGVPGDVTGRIGSIKLPTGGTITYTYSGTNNGIRCSDGTTMGLTRTTSIANDGSITYARSGVTATGGHVEITGPHQDQTEVDFANAAGVPYETTRSVYSGSHSTGTLLAKTDTCYNSVVPPNCTAQSLAFPVTKVAIYHTVGSVENGSENTYDNHGLLTDVKEYDYGNSTRGPLLRETVYSYAILGGYLTDRVAGVRTYSGAGTQYAATTYGYDEAPRTVTSGIPQHISTSAPWGNLTSQHVWTSSSNALTAQYTVDDTGTLLFTTQLNQSSSGTSYPHDVGYGYDATHTLVTSVTPTTAGVSLATQYTNDANTGLVKTMTDPNQTVTTYTYDNMLRLQEVDVLANGSTMVGKTKNTFTPNQTDTQIFQSPSTPSETVTLFDALGRQTRVAVNNGQATNTWYQMDTCLNQASLTSFSSYPYQGTGFGTSPVCSGSGDTTTYDALGRVSGLSHGDSPTTNIAYQYAGRATKVTDENGVIRVSQVDGLGRPTAVCEVSSNGTMPGSGTPANCNLDLAATGFATTYAYDDPNQKTTITQGAQTRTFQTDWAGRSILTTEPERGTTTFSYDFSTYGLIMTRKRPKANQFSLTTYTTTTTQYDAWGRPLSIGYDDGLTPAKAFYYDSPNSSQQWTTTPTNVVGRLVQMSSGTGSTLTRAQFGYDAVGNVTSLWQCAPSICGTASQASRSLSFGYDWTGNMLALNDSYSGNLSYTYSPAGEITSVTNFTYNNATNPGQLVKTVVNGPNGPISYALGNGLSGVNGYDILGRKTGSWVCSGSAAASCAGGTQLYGNTAAFKGVRQTTASDTVLNQSLSYGYDEFNRLSSRTVTQGTVQNYTYVYDVYGNRWQQNIVAGGGPSFSISFSSNNQASTNTYDAAGNVRLEGSHTYTYDAEGNIWNVDGGATAAYTYDAMNHRVRVQTSSVTNEFTYDPNNRRVSRWIPSSNVPDEARLYWGDRQLGFRGSNAQTFFEHQDVLGTERLRTNYQGQAAGTFPSLPFGDGYSDNVLLAGSDQDNSYFAGLEKDTESATDHAQFRQYSNKYGRWMSPDPYSGSYDTSNPQSLNRYTYAANNPVAAKDPTGLMMCNDLDCIGDPGGCDPFWDDCYAPPEEPAGEPSAPAEPEYNGWKDIDPDKVLTERLGIPANMKLPSGDLLSIFGIDPKTGCEFGACGSGGLGFGRGNGGADDLSEYFYNTTVALIEAPFNLLRYGQLTKPSPPSEACKATAQAATDKAYPNTRIATGARIGGNVIVGTAAGVGTSVAVGAAMPGIVAGVLLPENIYQEARNNFYLTILGTCR